MGEIWAYGSSYSVALGQAHLLSLKDGDEEPVSIGLSQEASLQPRLIMGPKAGLHSKQLL